jgi:hypothetical protein
MSWSKDGSVALASIKALHLNKEQKTGIVTIKLILN